MTPDKLYSDVIPRSVEYGALVFFLVAVLVLFLFAIWYLVKRNTALNDKMLEITERSIQAFLNFERKMDDVLRSKN